MDNWKLIPPPYQKKIVSRFDGIAGIMRLNLDDTGFMKENKQYQIKLKPFWNFKNFDSKRSSDQSRKTGFIFYEQRNNIGLIRAKSTPINHKILLKNTSQLNKKKKTGISMGSIWYYQEFFL